MADENPTPGAGGGEPGKEPQKLALSQDELNELIEARLARERKKFADYDALKAERETLLAEKKTRDEADLTEAQKLSSRMSELEKALAESVEGKKVAEDKLAREQVITEAGLTGQWAKIARESSHAAEALTEYISETLKPLMEAAQPTKPAGGGTNTAPPATNNNALLEQLRKVHVEAKTNPNKVPEYIKLRTQAIAAGVPLKDLPR